MAEHMTATRLSPRSPQTVARPAHGSVEVAQHVPDDADPPDGPERAHDAPTDHCSLAKGAGRFRNL